MAEHAGGTQDLGEEDQVTVEHQAANSSSGGAAQPDGNADEESVLGKGESSHGEEKSGDDGAPQAAVSPHEPAEPASEISQEPSQEPSAPPSDISTAVHIKQEASVTAAQAETVLAALQAGGGAADEASEEAVAEESGGGECITAVTEEPVGGSVIVKQEPVAPVAAEPAKEAAEEDDWVMPPGAAQPSLSQYTSKGKEAHTRIERNKYDLEAWKMLVGEVQVGGPMKHLFEEVYERLLAVFPTSGRHWILFAQGYLADNNKKEAIAAFQRALPMCPQVELWRAYLSHFTSMHSGDTETVRKEYDKALDAVGHDIASNAIWADCIAFHRDRPEPN